MLTGALKNKTDSLWEMFRTGGITNPLDVVEQMTYLMTFLNSQQAIEMYGKMKKVEQEII